MGGAISVAGGKKCESRAMVENALYRTTYFHLQLRIFFSPLPQHEFVEAERKILGRADGALTAAAGYAGGRAGASEGKVCYHNGFQVASRARLDTLVASRALLEPESYRARVSKPSRVARASRTRVVPTLARHET